MGNEKQAILDSMWNLIRRLPTNESCAYEMKNLSCLRCDKPEWEKIMPRHNKYKLLYNLQIIDSLVETIDGEVSLIISLEFYIF